MHRYYIHMSALPDHASLRSFLMFLKGRDFLNNDGMILFNDKDELIEDWLRERDLWHAVVDYELPNL